VLDDVPDIVDDATEAYDNNWCGDQSDCPVETHSLKRVVRGVFCEMILEQNLRLWWEGRTDVKEEDSQKGIHCE